MSRLSTRSEVERALSSHSLKSLDIARRIVAHSGLAPPLAVYEIGPGSGLLTAALAECTGRVIAIEHDRAAWALLRERFRDDPRVQAVLGDFLKCPLPRRGDYAVAGNIPFARTSAVMRHILGAPNPPRSSILVMQREAALRWSGAVRESEISVLAKTRFTFELRLALRRRDFVPAPRVECVALAITRKPKPGLDRAKERAFAAFVSRGFRGGRRTLKANLGSLVDAPCLGSFLAERGLDRSVAPGDLAYADWLDLFHLSRMPEGMRRIAGARARR